MTWTPRWPPCASLSRPNPATRNGPNAILLSVARFCAPTPTWVRTPNQIQTQIRSRPLNPSNPPPRAEPRSSISSREKHEPRPNVRAGVRPMSDPMSEVLTRLPPPRRSLLDLAPLELDCMNTLWPVGQATVREIRDLLAPRRPRAYTTIMTIMDRLARKGIVERRKVGRAYIYTPNLSAEDARTQALGQVIENFFGGSKDALLAQLNGDAPRVRAV